MGLISKVLGSEGEQYAYAYGKVSGMQAKLLKEKDFEAFITGRGVNEIVATLEGSPYEPDLQKAVGKEINIAKLERALAHHFLRITGEVTKAIPEEDRFPLDQIFVREWDLKNLKTVIRGVALKVDKEEIIELFDAFGELDEEFLTGLAGLGSVEQVVQDLKGKNYSKALDENLADYEKEGDLSVLESAMDAEYLDMLSMLDLQTKSGQLKKYIKMQNEALVLRNLKRAKSQTEFLAKLDGYYLSSKMIASLFAGDNVDEILAKTPYVGLLEEDVDIAVERVILRALNEEALKDPLGISSIIHFVKQKEREAKNLRAIIIGRTNELDAEIIRSLLI